MMNKVLYALCRECVHYELHPLHYYCKLYPVKSKILSDLCALNLYETRRQLKFLKENGLIESFIESEGSYCIMRGYMITSKAKETEEYKRAYKEELEYLKSHLF